MGCLYDGPQRHGELLKLLTQLSTISAIIALNDFPVREWGASSVIRYHQPQKREGWLGAIIRYQPTSASAAAWWASCPPSEILKGGGSILKFIVVGYRRRDLTREQFRRYFRETHGPLAAAIPGVRRYIQNFVEPDGRRDPPWDIVVEFWFDNREAMETAWQSQKGRLATDDNSNCLDLERTRWSVVNEVVVVNGGYAE